MPCCRWIATEKTTGRMKTVPCSGDVLLGVESQLPKPTHAKPESFYDKISTEGLHHPQNPNHCARKLHLQ